MKNGEKSSQENWVSIIFHYLLLSFFPNSVQQLSTIGPIIYKFLRKSITIKKKKKKKESNFKRKLLFK